MAYKKQKSLVDPVVIITFGVVLVAIAFVMIVFQSGSQSALEQMWRWPPHLVI